MNEYWANMPPQTYFFIEAAWCGYPLFWTNNIAFHMFISYYDYGLDCM